MLPLKDDVPSRSFPWVTVFLITLNSSVFLWEIFLGSEARGLIQNYAVVPRAILSLGLPRFHTLLTSMFLHGGWGHIIGNMLYLWIFGDNVEDCLGKLRYVLFYLLCGVVASFAHILTSAGSTVPTIGASGAISGILGGYLLLYPRAGVWTFIFFGFFIRMIKVPAFVVLGFWILLQLLQGVASLPQASAGGGVAWFAHIGGFFAGLAFVKLLQKRPPVRSYRRW
jgi:membrane associated rhomboid family serine protease